MKITTEPQSELVAWARFALTMARAIVRRVMGKGVTYLSGPMRGHTNNNYPAFESAEERLVKSGRFVISPARLGEVGVWNDNKETAWNKYMVRDIIAVALSTEIALLPGYEGSKGASMELAVAEAVGASKVYLDKIRFDGLVFFAEPLPIEWRLREVPPEPELGKLDVTFTIETYDGDTGDILAAPMTSRRVAAEAVAMIKEAFNGCKPGLACVEITAPIIHSAS